MADLDSSFESSDRYVDFTITTHAYKTVGTTPIRASLLIPKSLALSTSASSSTPIVVRWHGGYLVTGSRLYPDYFAPWILDFARQHAAIVVSPDYRLLPESSGADIMSDVADFWSWLHSTLPTLPALKDSSIVADTARVLVVGESAGGYLTVQSALHHPKGILVGIAQCAVLDVASPWYTQKWTVNTLDEELVDGKVVEDYLAQMKPGEIVTGAGVERGPLAVGIVQNGRFLEFLGTEDKQLRPMEIMGEGKKIAPLFIIHGRQDRYVPMRESVEFADKIRAAGVGNEVHLALEDGDHVFDVVCKREETKWLDEGLAFAERFWPAGKS